MGTVIIGRVSYEADFFKLIDGVLEINDSKIYLKEEDKDVQLQVNGSDLILAKLSCYTDCLITGMVGKVYSRGTCCIVGRLTRFFSKSNSRFINGTAKSEYQKAKNKMLRGIEGRKRLKIKCSGVFDTIYIKGDVEVCLWGNINSIFSYKDVLIKGFAESVVAEKSVYISK